MSSWLFQMFLWGIFASLARSINPESKIAFLFLTRGPMPLEDIWHEFFTWRADPNLFSIYVHTPQDYAYPNGSIFYNRNHNLVSTSRWGQFSLVLAIKSLVKEALNDPLNERFCLMSESDIPLVPFPKFRSVLLSHEKSVVNACPMEGMEVNRWHSDLDATGIKKSDWRKSSTWFSLNRRHALVFVDELASEKAWDHVPCADEHYLATILAWKGYENETTCADGFAYVHWPSASASHPTTFSSAEIGPELFTTLSQPIKDHYTSSPFTQLCSGYETVCHFTARKFSPSTRIPLLNSIKYILGEPEFPYTGNPWVNSVSQLRRVVVDTPLDSMPKEQLYLIENYKLRLLPDIETAKAIFQLIHFNESDISLIPRLTEEEKVQYPIGFSFPTRKDGILYKLKSHAEVWYMKGGYRCSVPNWDTFLSLNKTAGDIYVIDHEDMGLIPIGAALPSV